MFNINHFKTSKVLIEDNFIQKAEPFIREFSKSKVVLLNTETICKGTDLQLQVPLYSPMDLSRVLSNLKELLQDSATVVLDSVNNIFLLYSYQETVWFLHELYKLASGFDFD
jgi:hypothetical protein